MENNGGNPKQIDTDYTHEIVCPYCGYQFVDSWEYSIGSFDGETKEIDCQECDNEFIVQLNMEVTYTTSKKEA